jgi:hypothetical protein
MFYSAKEKISNWAVARLKASADACFTSIAWRNGSYNANVVRNTVTDIGRPLNLTQLDHNVYYRTPLVSNERLPLPRESLAATQ